MNSTNTWTEKVCGMTWGWTGVRGSWTGPEAEFSMERMADMNVNCGRCAVCRAGNAAVDGNPVPGGTDGDG